MADTPQRPNSEPPRRTGRDKLRDWLVGFFTWTVAIWLLAALLASPMWARVGGVLAAATACVLVAFLSSAKGGTDA